MCPGPGDTAEANRSHAFPSSSLSSALSGLDGRVTQDSSEKARPWPRGDGCSQPCISGFGLGRPPQHFGESRVAIGPGTARWTSTPAPHRHTEGRGFPSTKCTQGALPRGTWAQPQKICPGSATDELGDFQPNPECLLAKRALGVAASCRCPLPGPGNTPIMQARKGFPVPEPGGQAGTASPGPAPPSGHGTTSLLLASGPGIHNR